MGRKPLGPCINTGIPLPLALSLYPYLPPTHIPDPAQNTAKEEKIPRQHSIIFLGLCDKTSLNLCQKSTYILASSSYPLKPNQDLLPVANSTWIQTQTTQPTPLTQVLTMIPKRSSIKINSPHTIPWKKTDNKYSPPKTPIQPNNLGMEDPPSENELMYKAESDNITFRSQLRLHKV